MLQAILGQVDPGSEKMPKAIFVLSVAMEAQMKKVRTEETGFCLFQPKFEEERTRYLEEQTKTF